MANTIKVNSEGELLIDGIPIDVAGFNENLQTAIETIKVNNTSINNSLSETITKFNTTISENNALRDKKISETVKYVEEAVGEARATVESLTGVSLSKLEENIALLNSTAAGKIEELTGLLSKTNEDMSNSIKIFSAKEKTINNTLEYLRSHVDSTDAALFKPTYVSENMTATNICSLSVDTSEKAITIKLPDPGTVNNITLFDAENTFGTNNLIIEPNSGGTIVGCVEDESLEVDRDGVTFTLVFLNNKWRLL